MNRKLLPITIYLAIISLFAGLAVAQAQYEPPPSGPEAKNAQDVDLEEFLLTIPLPQANDLDVPAGLTRITAKRYATRLAWKQAQPILDELRSQQRRGEIAGFELQADKFALAVRLPTNQAKSLSHSLPDGFSLLNGTKGSACIEKSAKALQHQVLGLSRAKLMRDKSHTTRASATDPSIDVYIVPGGYWGYISGMTTPNTLVDIRIIRGGNLIFEGNDTSSSYGFYALYPEWSDCSYGYNWMLQVGDVIEVSAHGNTVSTVVAPLSGWVDPVSNTVEGITEPGRSVDIEVLAAGLPCTYDEYWQSVPTDGSGHFLADFTSLVNFDRRAWADIYAFDANGNSTSIYSDAFFFGSEFGVSDFWGVLEPSQAFTATLRRGGPVLDTFTGITDFDGWYYGWFSDIVQPSDVIEVTDGENTITYIATSFDAQLDATSNTLSGTTGAGRRVEAGFEKRDYGYVMTTCSYNYGCVGGTANGSGDFDLDSPFDIERGDMAWVDVYDSEGNFQYTLRNSPAILGDLTFSELHGYWSVPEQELNVVLKDASNAIKDSFITWPSYDGELYDWFYAAVLPGDHIEVGNGVLTETMTVQNLTGQLNNNTEHLTGTASNSQLLAAVYDFRSDIGYWDFACQETTVSGGAYNLDFSSMQIGGRDYADVFSNGPDGHYTYRYASAFRAVVYMQEADVWGYTMSPDVLVTVNIWDGDSLIGSDSSLSEYDGYYEVYFGMPLAVGQRVEVLADLSTNIVLPQLTMNLDPDNNRIYGISPANHLVNVDFDSEFLYTKGGSAWDYAIQYVLADSGGNYSAWFDGYTTVHCRNAQVNPCIWLQLTYWRPDGHRVTLAWGPLPVSTDAWENDNTFATAKPYSGLSEHTFHTSSDVDWIYFTINEDMVGKPWYLQTLNLGTISDTVLELYGTDGTSLLGSNDDYGGSYRSLLVWTPPSVGIYYIKIKPYEPWSNTENCGATYSFVINAPTLYLPIITR